MLAPDTDGYRILNFRDERTVKFSVRVQSWFDEIESDPAYWSYFAFSEIRLVEGKIVPTVLSLMRQNRHSLLGFPKFSKEVSIWHQREKHCGSYFAIRIFRLLGLVKWQRRHTWICVRSLLQDLKPWKQTQNLNPKPKPKTWIQNLNSKPKPKT